jgi:hypothetical protein
MALVASGIVCLGSLEIFHIVNRYHAARVAVMAAIASRHRPMLALA